MTLTQITGYFTVVVVAVIYLTVSLCGKQRYQNQSKLKRLISREQRGGARGSPLSPTF